MGQLFMIGNTHFDPVWLWKWDEAMASIRATFRSALDRMEETEEFIYSFSTPPVFEWIRETDPGLFEQIRQRVAEGRWELAEGWWLQPDCYSASGESYIRQGLYGQRWLLENFGKLSDCVFNIDSFGHSPMLPQILQKSGIRYYCFVRPEPWHRKLDNPLFRWASPDGSEVLTYRAQDAYFVNWDQLDAQYQEDALIVYGVTDHGGAPTKEAIAQIQSRENLQFSTVRGFFRSHGTDRVIAGELLTGDFGPYANYSRIKTQNRIAEYSVLNAEKASLLAGRDDSNALSGCWKDILFNQFHDILGGASIRDAYTDAEAMLGRAMATANELIHFRLQAITHNIQMPGRNPDNAWNIVAWNLNGSPYDGFLEAEVQWVHEFGWYDQDLCLEDEMGTRYPCQIIREKSVIPRFRSRFIFPAHIPSLGYRALRLVQTGEAVEKASVDPYRIRTDRLAITFNEHGVICNVTDTITGVQLAHRLLEPVCYEDKGDTWAFNISAYETESLSFRFEGFRVLEAGALLTQIKGVYRLGENKVELTYRFYAGSPYFDVAYRVCWEDAHRVLKLECDIPSAEHTAAVPAGSVRRSESEADIPLGPWLSANGITFVPKSLFAYNLHQGTLGFTVLRSAIYGDLRLGELDETAEYDIIDRGIGEGSLRVCFQGDPWKAAEGFCNSPIVIVEGNHAGELPACGSFFALQDEGVQLLALKKCEDDNSVIVRLLETAGSARPVSFTFRNQPFRVSIGAFEIKTLKLENGNLKEVDLLEFSHALPTC